MDDKFEIFDERCTGKTTRAICICLEYGATLVCRLPEYAKIQLEKISDRKLDVISYKQYLSNIDKYKDTKVFIDDINGFVDEITNGCYIGFTYGYEPNCLKYHWCGI